MRSVGQYFAQSNVVDAAGSLVPPYGDGWRVLRVHFVTGAGPGTIALVSPRGNDLLVSTIAAQSIVLEPLGNKPAASVDWTGGASITVEWVR